MFKRLASVLLSLVLLVSLCVSAFAEGDGNAGSMDCREDGSFHILIVADFQESPHPQQATFDLFEAELNAAQPDLVILLGDQVDGFAVRGANNALKTIDLLMQPIVARNLPFAFVFGNHDDEGGASKVSQLEKYQSYPNCMTVDTAGLTGVGNCTITIRSHDGTRPIAALYFIDSGTYAPKGEGKYAYVADDQIAWFLRTAESYASTNDGQGVPGYVFQHIVVPEIYDALEEVPASQKDESGVVEGSSWHKGRYYRLGENFPGGALREGPCPPDVNNGEFAAWQQSGSIVAGFFGHDHVNDFEGSYDGIDLINTDGTGFFSYGAGEYHGARELILNENAPGEYTTRMLYYKDIVSAPLPSNGTATHGAFLLELIALGVGLGILVPLILFLVIRRAVLRKRAQ